MVIGAIAGAAAAGFGAYFQYKAAHEANVINYMNLQFQKQNARKQNELATAPRTDVYGNKLKYVPGVGWQYELTPTTKAISTAQQREELLSLTEDAKRNREFRERQDEMSKVGGEEYDKALTEYRYAPRPSEGDIQSDFTRMLLLSRDKGMNEAKADLARQALRMGQGEQIKSILDTAERNYADTFEEAILKGKQLGSQEYRTQKEFVEGDIMDRLNYFGGVANKFDPAQIRGSRTPSDLNAVQGDMLKQMAAALSGEASQVGGAYTALANSARQAYPDMSGVASALSRIKFGGGNKGPGTFSASVVSPYASSSSLSSVPTSRTRGDTGFDYLDSWFNV